MNRENLQLWLDDLRTTKEPQTTGMLHNHRGFCCLGRGCVVASANGARLTCVGSDDMGGFLYNELADIPPEEFTNWLELGIIEANSLYEDAIKWNDTERLGFPEIADKIEAWFS